MVCLRRVAVTGGVVAMASACAQPGTVHYRRIEPRPSRVTVPPPPASWLGSPERPRTAAIVGTVFDCRGQAVSALLRVRRDAEPADTLSLRAPEGQFTIGPLAPGTIAVDVLAPFATRRTWHRSVVPGRLDTVAVRLSDDELGLAIEDCWQSGKRFEPCPARTAYSCPVEPI